MSNILSKREPRYTKIFTLSLIASSLLFLVYQLYLLRARVSLFFYLDMAVIAFSFVYLSIIGNNGSRNNIMTNGFSLFTLILVYTFLKLGYLLVVTPNVLSTYPDAYVVYQIAKSLTAYNHLLEPHFYTLGAQSLSVTPIVPIFLHILSTISGLNVQYVVKYYPLICAPLMVIAFSLILKKFGMLNKSIIHIGIMIGVFNPWMLGFLTWGHYANFSVLFLFFSLWTILSLTSDNGGLGRLLIVYVVFVFAMSFAHIYMEIAYLVILAIYLIASVLITRRRVFNRLCIFFLIACIDIAIHLLYYATIYESTLISYVQYIIEALESGNPTFAIQYYGAPQASSLPVVVIKYAGVLSLTILSVTSMMWYYLKCKKEVTKYFLPASIVIAGIILNIPYYFLPLYGTNLFNRLIFFVSIGASPFIATYVGNHFDKLPKKKSTFRYAVFAILLFFILMFSLLHAVNPDIVDWSTPIVSGEDVRFPRTEWYVLSQYVSSNMAQGSEVFGLRIGLPFIGLLAQKDYKQLSISPSNPKPLIAAENFKEITLLKGKLVFLRYSMVKFPDSQYIVKNDDFLYVIQESNIIYSASDAIVIMP